MPISTAGITGSDGGTPVYDGTALWKQWSLTEIYTGGVGTNRFVPKLNDYVVNTDTDEKFRVTGIDATTLIPTLTPITTVPVGSFSQNDIILGVGPGTASDTYRIYIDKSVIPFSLAVEARLFITGTRAASAKIFKGSQLTGNEQVISLRYNNTGELIDNTIPLESVYRSLPNGQQVAAKAIPRCSTTTELIDGEIVTAVIYSDTGVVISKRQLLVENTAFIPTTGFSTKYVTGISIKTPFLSQADPLKILYPINVPLSSLGLIGVVNYSDGSKNELAIDGTKFSLFGFENFISSIVGQTVPLVLKYTLSSDEVVYGANVGSDKFISQTYRAITTTPDGSFNVKLYPWPVWVNAANGYRLDWFVYNLDRNLCTNVTPYVSIDANSGNFSPKLYGYNQKFTASINLRNINGTNRDYTYVQNIDVTLLVPGTTRSTNWTLAYDINQDPRFGVNNAVSTTFINQNLSKLRLGMGLSLQADWLTRLYLSTKPLFDPNKEVTPVTPTHFQIYVAGNWIEYAISMWNTELTLNSVIPDSSTLYIRFIKRTTDNDLHLSIAGVPVYQAS